MSAYQHMAESLESNFRKIPTRGGKPSPAFVEYLEVVYTREEADVLQYLRGYPVFQTTDQIAGLAGFSTNKTCAVLEQAYGKNTIIRMGNTWSFPPMALLLNIPCGFSNAPFDRERAAALYQDFFIRDQYYKSYECSGKGTPSMRIIPVNRSIKPGEKILSSEEAHEFIHGLNHDDIVLSPCPCRTRTEILGVRECADKNPLGSCIHLGVSALHLEAVGVGERVTKNQALVYFDEMQKLGLVGATDNVLSENTVICLCCGCCCSHLRGRTVWDNPEAMDPSNFIPELGDGCVYCGKCADRCWLSLITVDKKKKSIDVDTLKCIGCGICTLKCPTGAISLVREERSVPFATTDALYKTLARENDRDYL